MFHFFLYDSSGVSVPSQKPITESTPFVSLCLPSCLPFFCLCSSLLSPRCFSILHIIAPLSSPPKTGGIGMTNPSSQRGLLEGFLIDGGWFFHVAVGKSMLCSPFAAGLNAYPVVLDMNSVLMLLNKHKCATSAIFTGEQERSKQRDSQLSFVTNGLVRSSSYDIEGYEKKNVNEENGKDEKLWGSILTICVHWAHLWCVQIRFRCCVTLWNVYKNGRHYSSPPLLLDFPLVAGCSIGHKPCIPHVSGWDQT